MSRTPSSSVHRTKRPGSGDLKRSARKSPTQKALVANADPKLPKSTITLAPTICRSRSSSVPRTERRASGGLKRSALKSPDPRALVGNSDKKSPPHKRKVVRITSSTHRKKKVDKGGSPSTLKTA